MKANITSSNVLFCPQPKEFWFAVMRKQRNQKIFTFKKLESENLDFVPEGITQTN